MRAWRMWAARLRRLKDFSGAREGRWRRRRCLVRSRRTCGSAERARAPAVDGNISADALSVGAASGIALRGTSATCHRRSGSSVWMSCGRRRAPLQRGRVELAGAQRVNLELSATDLDVSQLLRAFNQATVPANGTLSLQGNVAGTIARPTGSITIRGEDLAAYSEMLGTLAADLTLAGRQVVLSRMLLEKPQPRWGRPCGGEWYVSARSTCLHVRYPLEQRAVARIDPARRRDRARAG